MTYIMRISPAIILIFIISSCSWFDEEKTGSSSVEVNLERTIGSFKPMTRYINSSIRKAPPHELGELLSKDIGKADIIRVWLYLDNMWDYRTNEYNFNFQIGNFMFDGDAVKRPYNWDEVVETSYYYEEHLHSFCEAGKEVLMVLINYHGEVVDGTISYKQWAQVAKKAIIHYLEICPNLRYIEILNETTFFGSITSEEYYQFYKEGYRIVNEINQELALAVPLKVGGPTSAGRPLYYRQYDDSLIDAERNSKSEQLYLFLKKFALDGNPKKKLDFISFHEYELAQNPNHISNYEEIINSYLIDFSLDENMPIFIDECGIGPLDEISSLEQSTGIMTLFKYTQDSPTVALFPWVIYHTEEQQPWVMYDSLLRKTAFGMACKLHAMHFDTEIETISRHDNRGGKGIHTIATKSANEVLIQIWNYSEKSNKTTVKVKNESRPLSEYHIKYYIIDQIIPTEIKSLSEMSSFNQEKVDNESMNLTIGPYNTIFLYLKEK